MAALARNNAFGLGSPSWNLSFPDGNLTVSEILAYLPHWLKSVDVILRLVSHGGRSITITHLLNKFRNLPTNDYRPNSTTVMMHYAMRRAGNSGWTIGTRDKFERDREYDENSLYVGDFRPPRLTHPKTASSSQIHLKDALARNAAAEPIPFKDLARHVKEHPSGNDALDLTRCVDYAIKHPKEKWLFPTDFNKLVEHIGGPLTVTRSHLDRQLFKRCDYFYATHILSKTPKVDGTDSDIGSDIEYGLDGDIEREGGKGEGEGGVAKDTKRDATLDLGIANQFVTRSTAQQSQHIAMTSTVSFKDDKRTLTQMDDSRSRSSGKRRSSRQVKKVIYKEQDEYATVQSITSATLH